MRYRGEDRPLSFPEIAAALGVAPTSWKEVFALLEIRCESRLS